jgi:hypothetical protein
MKELNFRTLSTNKLIKSNPLLLLSSETIQIKSLKEIKETKEITKNLCQKEQKYRAAILSRMKKIEIMEQGKLAWISLKILREHLKTRQAMWKHTSRALWATTPHQWWTDRETAKAKIDNPMKISIWTQAQKEKTSRSLIMAKIGRDFASHPPAFSHWTKITLRH